MKITPHKMQRFLAFSFLFLTQLPFLFSQEVFAPGYVILENSDTLIGKIQVLSELESQEKCYFIPKGSSTKNQYVPQEILGYGFIGAEVYKSKRPYPSKDPLFFQCLVEGKASLYKYHINNRGKYPNIYILEKDARFFDLTNFEETKEINGKRYLSGGKKYLNYLRGELLECKNIQSQISRTVYRDNTLAKLISQYNSCMGGNNLTHWKNTQEMILLSDRIGIAFGPSFYSKDDRIFPELPENRKINVYDIHYQFSLPFLPRKSQIVTGITYVNLTYKLRLDVTNILQEQRIITSTLKQLVLGVPLQYRHYGGTRRFKVYGQGGVILFIPFDSRKKLETTTREMGTTTFEEDEFTIEPDARFVPSLIVGVGAEYSLGNRLNLFLDMRYTPNTNVDNTLFWIAMGMNYDLVSTAGN